MLADAPSRVRSLGVRCVAWTAVKQGPRADSNTSTGVRPWAARQASFSAGCSETWACSGAPRTLRPVGDQSIARRAHGPHRVDRRADSDTLAVAQLAGPFGPSFDGAVAEPELDAVEWNRTGTAEPAMEVTGVEQREPDAGGVGGGEERLGHRVLVVVRRTSGLVMDVVELADRGDARHRHLAEHGAGEAVVVVGGEPAGDVVHLVAPRPERAATAVLGAAPKHPVESVAVHVGETRAASARRVVRPGPSRS